MDVKKLITKHILGLTSESEEDLLHEWASESQRNKQYLYKINRRGNYSQLYASYRMKRKSCNEKRFLFRKKYAMLAACVIPFALLFSFFIYTHFFSVEIMPGCSKAVLLLNDGERISLDESEEPKWIFLDTHTRISKSKGTISYINDRPNNLINDENIISVPRGGEYKIILSDGTKVHLNSMSILKFPISFNKNRRSVTLTGEAYFEIAKDSLRPFIVNTDGIAIRQYGTKFSVEARSSKHIKVALEEGSVGLLVHGKEVEMMKSGDVALWQELNNEIKVNRDELEECVAWHYGRMIFDENTLGEIMNKLELWYDCDVEFADPKIRDIRFTGNVSRYEKIDVLLSTIENIENLKIDINNKLIRIGYKIDKNTML